MLQQIEAHSKERENTLSECVNEFLANKSYGFINCLLNIIHFAGRAKNRPDQDDAGFEDLVKNFVNFDLERQKALLKNYLSDHNLTLLLTRHFDTPKLIPNNSGNDYSDE